MTALLLVIISFTRFSGTIGGISAAGYSSYLNNLHTSTLGEYIRLGIQGSFITPELLVYTVNLGLQHNRSNTVVSSTRMSTKFFHIPYTIILRFQPNHFAFHFGHQKQTIKKRFWENKSFSQKYLGVSQKTWGRFTLGTWLNMIYSHETLRSNEPTNRRYEFFNSFSMSTYHETKTMNLSNKLLIHSYTDKINGVSRNNASYYFGYRLANDNYIFRNIGILNWESTNRMVGLWNSFIQRPYRESAYFGVRIGERVVLKSGENPSFGTTFGVTHNRMINPSLRTHQYVYIWRWSHRGSVNKALFSTDLKYSKKFSHLNLKLSPIISVFHGIWQGNPGDEIRVSNGVGISPRLPLSSAYLNIDAYVSKAIRTGYLYYSKGSPWDVRFVITSRAMSHGFGGVSFQWESARGIWGGEPQVYPYSYTRWRIAISSIILPIVLNFQESIDHQYKAWSQSLWISLRRQVSRNLWINYVQVLNRSNYQGTPRRYWEHKLMSVTRFFMLRINFEAYYKLDFLTRGWTGNYKIEITRSI